MVILGIDPGYAIVGYGVVEFRGGKYCPLEYGAIVTKAGEPFPRRFWKPLPTHWIPFWQSTELMRFPLKSCIFKTTKKQLFRWRRQEGSSSCAANGQDWKFLSTHRCR